MPLRAINGILTIDDTKQEKKLRKQAKRVDNVRSQASESLVLTLQHMATLCAQDNVLGIAANQLGQPIRLFAISDKILASRNKKYNCTFFFNTRLIDASEETYTEVEACLSVPGKVAIKKRHAWVRIAWQDETGMHFEWKFDGLLGKAIQHELGHDHGELCIDGADKVLTDEEMERVFAEAQAQEEAEVQSAESDGSVPSAVGPTISE